MAWAGEKMLTTDFWTDYAMQEIQQTYGVRVRPKWKTLLKFGRHPSLGSSFETIWMNGADEANETYLTTNTIDSVSSSSTNDTGDIVIEGHTVDASGNFTFVTRAVTLTGQTRAPVTGMARANRLYNADGTAFDGDIYVYENTSLTSGAPTDKTKVHLKAPTADNQSLKAATTISQIDYWAISLVHGSVNKQTSANVDFRFQVREKGGVFRSRIPGTAGANGSSFNVQLKPYFIVPSNADFRIIAAASTTNVAVDAFANGILLIKDD